MITKAQKVLKLKLQNDLLFFFRYFFKKRYGYKANIAKHHIKICKTLQKVAAGKIKRLIINIPPRYGKTDIAVISFMAWSIANNPKSKFIHLSYSDDLALDNSSQVKEIVLHDDFQALFNVTLRSDTKSKKKWYTDVKGGVYATAAGGQVTGFGAGTSDGDIFGGAIIIDDPLKPDDAHSDVARNRINQRFNNTISSRVNSRDTPIIVIMQRIHEDDMSGYLLNGGSGEDWTHLNIPALDDNNNAIWEFKHTTDELLTIKKGSSYTFAGQYMQQPSPSGGGIFKHTWLNWWEYLPAVSYKFITMDTAQKTNNWNDFTVMQCWGVCKDKGDLYLLDMVREKLEAPDLRVKAKLFITKHKHNTIHDVRLRRTYIEDKSSGSSLIQDLKKEGYQIKDIQRNRDKISRAYDTVPYIEQGRVYLNKNINSIDDLEIELAAFPNGKHDDTIDPLMDAIDLTFIGVDSASVAVNAMLS
jgi:predicted phage terminase large subunit-like protein